MASENDLQQSALPPRAAWARRRHSGWLLKGWQDYRTHPLPSSFYGACSLRRWAGLSR
jgi:hypothetical protein